MSLIADATNELNHRERGRDARLARLQSAGVPTERAALTAWLNSTLDAEHEAAHGIFHASTVRVSNGCDADLPTKHGVGCRIARVPVKATRVEVGTELGDSDDPVSEAYWSIQWGACGTGFMAATQLMLADCPTAEEAEERARRRLLAQGDCFATRDEAVAAVKVMLDARVASHSLRA